MATPVTKPPSSSAAPSQATQAIVGKPKAGFDPRRPFRYAWGFISGTVRDSLDMCASLGRKGMWVGAAVGVLAMMSGMGPMMIFTGMVGGLAVGAVGGLALGAITGGVRGVARAKRIEDNAELAEAHTRAKPARQRVVNSGPDYREMARRQREQNNYAIDRVVQSERETQQDLWTDRVSGNGHDHGRW